MSSFDGNTVPAVGLSASANSASLLFRLPLEIRELIYAHLVAACRDPPEPDFKTTIRGPPPIVTYRHQAHLTRPGSLYFPVVLPKYALLPILQTCHQSRTELQEFISLLQKASDGINPYERAKLGYTLDVCASAHEYFTSWRSLPLPCEEPYNIIPEFLINFNVAWIHARHWVPTRFGADGSLSDDGFDLFFLLNCLFNHGPQGFYVPRLNGDGTDENRCLPFVKKLVFNVSFTYSSGVMLSFQVLQKEKEEEEAHPKEDGSIEISAKERLEHFTNDMEDWKTTILSHGFKSWFAKFLSGGYLDGCVEEVVLLHDGIEKWDTPLVRGGERVACKFNVSGLRRRGLKYETITWGTVGAFQRKHEPKGTLS
ncbi:hypothetical protein ABW20_dc0106380 [Dactylellina cionopaga]|nr:hypothetical protein ABW20_dc0106380 [Dactylellina cionopaga]